MSRYPAARRLASAGGFTLLELLVVLVLAAITLSVVGVGGHSYMERSRYHQAVREVATQLNQARALSVREGRPVAVTYQPEERSLLVDGKASVVMPAAVAVEWKAMESPVTGIAAPGELLFVFNADGGARGGRLAVMRGGHGLAFGVNWLLGTIEQAVVQS